MFVPISQLLLTISSAGTTEEVLNHHLQSFGSCDLDGIMADYVKDSTLITPDGALHGLDEIRALFVQLFDLVPPGSDFEMKQLVIEGEVAYILWSVESEKVKIPLGTDTFVIRDGKIITQTFAGDVQPKI